MAKLLKNWTIQEKMQKYLELKFEGKIVESRTGKYIVIQIASGTFYLLGKGGGVRKNEKPTASGSRSISPDMAKINQYLTEKGF